MENESYLQIFKKFNAYLVKSRRFTGRTMFSYPKIVEHYLNYVETFNVLSLNDISQEMTIKFVKLKGDKKYAKAYVNLRLSALNVFYTWAYKNRLCNNHLILEYKKSKLNNYVLYNSKESSVDDTNSTIVFLQHEDQEKILNFKVAQEFTAIRNKCIVELILAGAIYASEIIYLLSDDLNLKKGYIDIIDTNRERRVWLNTSICLKSCIDWLNFREETLSSQNNICQFLFFTKNFEQLTKRRLYEIISQYLLSAGIVKERLGSDVLRQTAICNMFRDQMTIEEVQQATGIQTLSILEKYRIAADECQI
jgi:site-specific recombinase XerD